jgi:two-component system response regulator HydG
VLITGETGTGKELVANALHYEGNRVSGPLIKVNCAALTESLLDSELFGHEKGAFTGAEKRRAGRFERADGGTLVLDEITEMGEHVQAKLLRVLQNGEFERVGGDEPLEVDVRVIAITNRDPLNAVEHGKLRKDLYYRLNTVNIVIPPLRDRRDDIPPLADAFLSVYSEKHRKNIKAITPDAMSLLVRYDWPGNVRELEHCLERAVLLAEGDTLTARDISPHVTPATVSSQTSLPGPETLNLQDLERQTVLKALNEAGWNKTQAAQKLGIFPSSLYKKMKRLDIPIAKQV